MSNNNTDGDDRPIDTKEASKLCERLGFPTAEASLTKMRCCGGGPAYLKFKRAVRYRPSSIKAWLSERTHELRHTSEQPAPKAA
jgi:hypothetical protein